MTQKYYGIKISTLLNAADTIEADLDYVCSLAESPDEDFPIADAVVYSYAVMALTQQLDYIMEDISKNPLSEDEEYVRMTAEEISKLNSYTEYSEEALLALEKICKISLKSN